MILSADSGVCGVLVNADTGQPIRHARWADTDTGEYEAFRVDPVEAQRLGIPLESLLYRGRARLRFLPGRPQMPATPTAARDLAEADRDWRAKHADTIRQAQRILATPGQECCERLCHRLATWKVTDVQRSLSEVGAGGMGYTRGVLAAVRLYCDRHYRPPTVTSERGVVEEIDVGVRPQW